MLKYLIISTVFLSACASAPAAQTSPVPKAQAPIPLTQSQRFDLWKQGFIARAIAKNHAPDLVNSVIGPAKINPKAILSDKNQPEFSRPIWAYVDGVASAGRLNGGRDKLVLHQTLFGALETRYGVDRHILTAIWGLESSYGKIIGNEDMISSIATLAFEGRRGPFWERELLAVLDLLASGDIRREQLIGSWAGAMGMTQFIPSTFRDYAVDYDGNGNKDLWTDAGDALASAAYYLQRHGWRANEAVFAEVLLPKGFDYGLSDGTKRTVSGWAGMGVRPVSGQNWSKDDMFLEAKLLIPAGTKGPVFLSFKNFDVIKKYNNSTSYALGINVLAESLQGRRAIIRDWPRGDEMLSFTDKKNMQAALTRLGYDTGGIDGQIGPNSRKAVRAWQRANGLPADGYVEQRLLSKIMTK